MATLTPSMCAPASCGGPSIPSPKKVNSARKPGRTALGPTAATRPCGRSLAPTRSWDMCICPSPQQPTICMAAIGLATICSARAWSRSTPRPGSAFGIIKWFITAYGTTTPPPRPSLWTSLSTTSRYKRSPRLPSRVSPSYSIAVPVSRCGRSKNAQSPHRPLRARSPRQPSLSRANRLPSTGRALWKKTSSTSRPSCERRR